MLKPRALAPGDRLALVAPASGFKREEFDAGVEEIRRIGFVPVYDDSVFAQSRYVAGPAAHRADAIRRAWRDESIAGLIGVRGGYGSAQLLPLLDVEEIRRVRKPFVGYSDLTAVLTFLTTRCGVVAFHGPTVTGRFSRGPDRYDVASFLNALCRREPLGELTADSVEEIRPGEAAGVLLGGKLTQLVASLGTPFAFNPPAGYVLFLEDIGERPFRLNRMLTQLQQSGLLGRASAVVVGELPSCDEPDSSQVTARAVVRDMFGEFPGPVLFGFPSGHTTGAAITLPLGVQARVIGGARPRVIVEEAAVE